MFPITSWADRATHHSYCWQGLRLPYCTMGEGPPLILVHGLGLSLHEWERNVETLSSYGKVYALDLPGFGRSDKPHHALNCRQLALAALDWAAELDLPPAIWFGHSLGGEVALWAAALQPERVRGIVLAGATALPPRPGLPRRILGLLLDSYRESPAYVLRLLLSYFQAGPWRVLETVQISDAEPLLKLTARIQMPVLVLHGRRDPIISLAESRLTAARLPHGQLCLIDAPHAMNYTAAALCNPKIAEFLDQVLGGPWQGQTHQSRLMPVAES